MRTSEPRGTRSIDPEHLARRLAGAKGFVFDVDNTLYPAERGVWDAVNARIERFVQKITGQDPETAARTRRGYVEAFGTTLGGLMALHGVDPSAYLEYVHDVAVEEMLRPDRDLGAFLCSIGLPKVVLTNASARHARRVLRALGVEEAFLEVVDLGSSGYRGKPHRAAFAAAAEALGLPASLTILVDDVPANVAAAAALDMTSLLVGGRGEAGHAAVPRLGDLALMFATAPWWDAPSPIPPPRP